MAIKKRKKPPRIDCKPEELERKEWPLVDFRELVLDIPSLEEMGFPFPVLEPIDFTLEPMDFSLDAGSLGESPKGKPATSNPRKAKDSP